MASDTEKHDTHEERESNQALARIQHSRVDRDRAEPTPEPAEAAIVADPRNKLADGTKDPATGELRPAGK